MTKIIQKRFDNLKSAEAYQNTLYGKYESVKLFYWPRFSESGVYMWEVR